MTLLERFLIILDTKMNTPSIYGWFHFLFIFIVIIDTIILCRFGKNINIKTFKFILLTTWLVMVLGEIYKQINFSFHYNLNTNTTWWDYPWHIFPYQLCSTPIYLLPFVIYCKDGKFKDSVIAFLGTFAMFGGLITYIYPNQVFVSTIGVNIQTMVHHGLQIVIGIFLLVYYKEKLNIKFFIKGFYVFLIATLLALTLNLLAPLFTSETFNMFYISPYFPCIVPFVNVIFSRLPYPIFLFAYICGVTLASLLCFYSLNYIIKHTSKKP